MEPYSMKNVMFGKESSEHTAKGIAKFLGAISTTLGPAGRTVFIQRLMGPPLITKDGVTVAKEVHLPDPAQDMIVQTLKQVATNLGDEHGDGTTTSSVMASHAALTGLARKNEGNINSYAYGRGMRAAAADVCALIKTMNQNVPLFAPEFDEQRKNIIRNIAYVSSNGDDSVADLVTNAYGYAGKDGLVTIADSQTDESYVSVAVGYEFNSVLADTVFSGAGVLSNPLVIVVGDPLIYGKHVLPILKSIADNPALKTRPLVIFAPQIDGEAKAAIAMNYSQGHFKWVAVQVPGGIYPASETLKDIAACTGANYISEATGQMVENMLIKDLGSLQGYIKVSGNKTMVGGYKTDTELFQSRLSTLQGMMSDSAENKEKHKLLSDKIKQLTATIAVINVGASTAVSRNELKDRYDDAVCAVRSTLKGGYIVGGGNLPAQVAWSLLSPLLDEPNITDSYRLGYTGMLEAIIYPYFKIRTNGGMFLSESEPENMNIAWLSCMNHIKDCVDKSSYNLYLDNEFQNILAETHANRELQIIDPTDVVLSCITVSANMAATIVTTECTMSFVPKRNQD